MFDAENFESEIYSSVMDCLDGYCDRCDEMRYESDTGAWDCPYGGDIESCEHSPSEVMQQCIHEMACKIVEVMP